MPDLYSRFLDRANFHHAYKEVAANQGCAGVDGETIAQFAAHADRHLETLRTASRQANISHCRCDKSGSERKKKEERRKKKEERGKKKEAGINGGSWGCRQCAIAWFSRRC